MQKKFVLVASFLVFTIFLYWFKCFEGINLFTSVSISNYLPKQIQKLFRLNLVYQDVTGVLFYEKFDNKSMDNWQVQTSNPKKLTIVFVNNSLNNSSCLSIFNRDGEKWQLAHKKLILVKEGDKIELRCLMKVSVSKSGEGFGAVLFDKNFRVMNVRFSAKDQQLNNGWMCVSNTFTIPSACVYLRLVLTGSGKAESCFDELQLKRSKS